MNHFAPGIGLMDHSSSETFDDGPWIDMPDDMTISMTPPSYDDIVAMANLDDDPSVVSDKEREMIAVLMQVLGATPISY